MDLELAVSEAGEFRRLGGGTILDLTLPDVGRDPRALQAVSRRTGLNVVVGCGHYVHLAHPPSLRDERVESLAEGSSTRSAISFATSSTGSTRSG